MTRFDHTLTVIARLDRATQYAAAFRLDRRLPSVLDAPLEPFIGLAEGETRWRGMTRSAGMTAKISSEDEYDRTL
jgi:hypothetical protein